MLTLKRPGLASDSYCSLRLASALRIDSRDLARLVVQLLADDRPGPFHAVGPADPTTLGALIRTCARSDFIRYLHQGWLFTYHFSPPSS